MAAIVAPVALPDEAQLRQANLVTLIVVIVVCAVLLAAVISVLGCLFFCFRKKSYLISREKKNMRNEVKESVRHTSREVASVQKYLRDTSHISQPPVSLAVISSSTPPAVRRLVAETTASELRVSSEQDGEEEIVVDEDRPHRPAPPYCYPLHDTEMREDVLQEPTHRMHSPPSYSYPSYAFD